jgi:hypothetical protein
MTPIRSDSAAGHFDRLLAGAEPQVGQIARQLRALVLAVHPDAVEVVRLGDRAASYGLGPKKLSEAYIYIIPHQRHVNLGFYRGTQLPDPDGLLEGTGQRMRHVKVQSTLAVESPVLRRLIIAARDERRRALRQSGASR